MTQERNLDEGMSPLTPASSEGTARETGHVDHGTRVADESYFASRSLKSGSAGWFLLMGLGVAYVISGDFSGWNYGIAYGGWLGLLIAFIVMGLMYACTVFGLAELSSAMPTAGAGYGFARRAMGKFGGCMTGFAVLIEYVCAPAAISTFIANYVANLGILPEGVGQVAVIAAVFVVFVGLHLIGVGEALKVMLVITCVALLALVVFVVGVAPAFDLANFFNISPTSDGSSTALPFGLAGVVAALPFGIWFFLGVEGVPLAAEEANDPKRDMPKGIIGSMAVLIVTGLAVLFLAPGATGARFMGGSTAPLVQALEVVGQSGRAVFLNWAGLFGLVASFFSLVYAGSRQMFALSRAGYLPRSWALTGKRKTPVLALLIQGIVGFGLAVLVQNGDTLINVAVFGACTSYALINLSHILLRRREPGMHRGYRTPGGTATTTIGLCLSCLALVSTFFVDVVAACAVLALLIFGALYFWVWARHHLVANAPEEEFELVRKAEGEIR